MKMIKQQLGEQSNPYPLNGGPFKIEWDDHRRIYHSLRNRLWMRTELEWRWVTR